MKNATTPDCSYWVIGEIWAEKLLFDTGGDIFYRVGDIFLYWGDIFLYGGDIFLWRASLSKNIGLHWSDVTQFVYSCQRVAFVWDVDS